jgi:hypothetical protein
MPHNARSPIIAGLLLAFTAARAAVAAGPPANPPPKPTGLAETVEKRLVQLDVGVEGDADAIRGITAKDFALYVGEYEVQGLIVDHLCAEAPAPESEPKQEQAAEGSAIVAPKSARPRATFIFYFDQSHLTMMGRAESLNIARDIINRLIVDGSRASIVSSGSRLETIVPLTGDAAKLIAGLETLRTNMKQWDTYAATEERRAWEVMLPFSKESQCLRAEVLAREEWMEVRRSTERIGFAVSALTDAPVPKGLIYFGDTLRQKAGLHFLHLPAECSAAASGEMIPAAAGEFDALIREALARGVHLFMIEAQGFVSDRDKWDKERHEAAKDALVGLAAETGGEAFLGGASSKHMADRIAARSSCVLLLSFPPGDLPRDQPLSVTLQLNAPNVKIRHQGRIVVPSQTSLERAQLLAAFVDPAQADDGSLRVLLVPRGGDGKKWNASVQLRLRPSGLPDTSMELGASMVRHNAVTQQFSASIATKSGSRVMVLERSLDIAPGEFSVVAVARDVHRQDVVSRRLDAGWPNPEQLEAAIAPIAVLQHGAAAIARNGEISTSGSLARDVDEMLDPSVIVNLETVVCRGAKVKTPVIVERWLDDGQASDFAPMTIAETEAPCVQVVDAVPAARLHEGAVDYRVVARIGDDVVAQERRTLRIGAPVAMPAAEPEKKP